MQKSSKNIKSAYELKVVVKKLSQNLWDVSHTKYHRIGKASWLCDVVCLPMQRYKFESNSQLSL